MTYGAGRVFRRNTKWWIAYNRDGQEIREKGGADQEAAEKKLAARLRDRDRDDFLGPRESRARVQALVDDYILAGETHGKRSIRTIRVHAKPILAFFGSLRAIAVTSTMVDRYIAERRALPRADATINRELEVLRAAYRQAAKRTPPLIHASRVPTIPMLAEDNARQGFLGRPDFDAIMVNITDPDVHDFLTWNFWTAWRPGETAKLTWAAYDREALSITLPATAAKIKKARSMALAGPLMEIMQHRLDRRRMDTPLIFHRESKGQLGQPIKDYSKLWAQACKLAGLPAGRKVAGGLTPYDLRRSGIRNLIRSGVDQTVAKKISGHLTDSTFERYDITSQDDIRAAIEKVSAFVSGLPNERKVLPIAVGARNPHNATLAGERKSYTRTKVGQSGSDHHSDQAGRGLLAEAGGNRTHRPGFYPGPGQL